MFLLSGIADSLNKALTLLRSFVTFGSPYLHHEISKVHGRG